MSATCTRAGLRGGDLYFYDDASLQVLEGPQGTLFGKNTTARAVLLTTQRPTGRFEGYAQLRAGSYAHMEAEGALNLPITDVLDRYLRLQRFGDFRIDRVTPGRPQEFGGEAALKFRSLAAANMNERLNLRIYYREPSV